MHGRANSEQLSWVDRAGQASHPTPIPADGRLGQPDSYLTFRVSPDGRRVTVGRGSSNGRDVWTVETERDAWSRLTFLPGFALNPVWSPDGRQVIFSGRTPMNLYRKEASGAGTEQRITESANEQVPTDWSRDGRLVLYFEIAPGTQRDLWVLPVTPDGQLAAGASANAGARPYLRTRFNEYHGRFSPEQNPRWVAYHVGRVRPGRGLRAGVSGASGQVPDLDRRRRLPRVEPRRAGVVLSFGGWQADDGGRDHRRGFGGAVPTSRVVRSPGSGGRLRLPLFRCADGKRFLVLTPAGGSQPLEVIVNWPALLKKGVAGE